jgi:hypothetical protein
MEGRDRRRVLLLIGLAAVAWAGVATVLVLVDPLASSAAGFAGAGAFGAAAALTTAPLFWLVSFARHNRIAYRGDWWRALRRGVWVGALVTVFVIMRVNGIFQPPIALFFIALAIVAEVTLTAGGANRA